MFLRKDNFQGILKDGGLCVSSSKMELNDNCVPHNLEEEWISSGVGTPRRGASMCALGQMVG